MIKVKIVLPSKIMMEEEVNSLTIPGTDGDFTVLEGHTPFMSTIRSGIMTIIKSDSESYYAIHDGFATVEADEVSIVCETIEAKSEIDKKRAQAAHDRAMERVKSDPSKSEINFRRAEQALKRSLTRIQITEL